MPLLKFSGKNLVVREVRRLFTLSSHLVEPFVYFISFVSWDSDRKGRVGGKEHT